MTTGETKDPKGEDKTSAGDKGSTSEQETQTFTKEAVDAIKDDADKRVSDALAEAGRATKAAELAAKTARDSEERLRRNEEERWNEQEAAAQDNTEELGRIRKRRQDAQRASNLEGRERKAEQKEADNQTQTQSIRTFDAERLAEKYNVTSESLLEYGGETKATMEKLAKSYGERTSSEGESETEANRMKKPPDTGKTKGTAGQGKKPSLEEVQAATPAEYDAKVKSGEWEPFG